LADILDDHDESNDAENVPELAVTFQEICLLDQLVSDNLRLDPLGNTLSLYLTNLARLGGYLARAKDSPLGNIVMWRGLSALPISN
jgi:hypothetical protein